MKKTLLMISTIMLSLIALPVFAESDDAVEVRAEIKETRPLKHLLDTKREMEDKTRDMREIYEDRRMKLEDRKADIRASIDLKREKKDARVELTAEKKIELMQKRSDAAIDRLTKMHTRIESRILKLKEAGKDMTADIKLLAEVKSDIATLDAKATFSSDTSEEGMTKNRTLLSEVKNDLIAIHKKMMSIVSRMGFAFGVKTDITNN